jgi:hypothetical protein
MLCNSLGLSGSDDAPYQALLVQMLTVHGGAHHWRGHSQLLISTFVPMGPQGHLANLITTSPYHPLHPGAGSSPDLPSSLPSLWASSSPPWPSWPSGSPCMWRASSMLRWA